jgi:hypothetical protein
VRKAEEDCREALRVAVRMAESSGGGADHTLWFHILDRVLVLKNVLTITAEAPHNVVVLKSV